MPKELEIVTGMEFDKQDVVTVALAKAEEHIRGNVRTEKAKAQNLKEGIEKAKNDLPKLGEKIVPKHMLDKMKIFKTAARTAKLGKEITFSIQHSVHEEHNEYILVIEKIIDKGFHIIGNVVYAKTAFSKEQKVLEKQIERMEDAYKTALNEAVRWKAKLSDMNAFERQMRAKVVEAELNKTKDGKAILDILVKDFQSTIKQLEM